MFLLASGLGDTYGMGFEFVTNPSYPNNLTKLYEHPIQKKLGDLFRLHAGWFTDDTEMSIAVAEAICENDISHLTPEIFANKFIELFYTERRHGYAQGFYGFLNTIRSGRELIQYIKPNSDRNGATMRSGPLGFLQINEIFDISKMQAKITHDTFPAILSSQIIALMYHYVIYRMGSKKHIIDFLLEHLNKYYDTKYPDNKEAWKSFSSRIKMGTKGPTSIKGFEASLSVLDIFVNNSSASKALLECVDRGGDTDTAGGLVMGLAEMSSEYFHDLPISLYLEFIKSEPQIKRLMEANQKLRMKFMDHKQ